MTYNNVTLIVDVTVTRLRDTVVADYRVNSENCSSLVGSVCKNRNDGWRIFFINRKKGWMKDVIAEDEETAFGMVETNIKRFFKEFGINVEFNMEVL